MNDNVKTKREKRKNNRFLTIFICIFLSITLVFGVTMGIIVAVDNAKVAVRYKGVTISEGEARYLGSIYKKEYLRSLSALGIVAYDTASFWAKEAEDGVSYGELLERGFREYLSGIAVKSSLYLDTASFGSSDRRAVRQRVDKRLSYLGYDSERAFNEISGRVGFEYDDFVDGSELLYQSAMAYAAIYGADGSNLSNYPSECEKYLETYTRVSLIFLRSESVYVLDEAGGLTYDDDGEIVTRELTEEEKAERAATAAELREYIANYVNGENNAISPETFDIYLRQRSDTDPEMYDRGYYFREGAEITAQFAAVYPEVVEKAYEMELGEYAEVECSDGLCFIYRAPIAKSAYSDSGNVFFSDFYSDGSQYLFGEAIETLADEVEFTDKFGEIDITEIPSNSEYYVNSWS